MADFDQRAHYIKCLVSSCLYNLSIFQTSTGGGGQFPLWVHACEPACKTPPFRNLQLLIHYLYRTCLNLCALRQPSHLSSYELVKQFCFIYLGK
jgi:hypothetical protein